MKLGKIKNFNVKGNKLGIEYAGGKANINFISDEIVRFEIPCKSENYESVAVEGDKAVSCNYEVKKDADDISITGKKLDIKVSDDFCITILDKTGKVIVTDYQGERTIPVTISEKSLTCRESQILRFHHL